ncbi:MAG: hypothetical protein AB7F89_11200, partial [Pirellulaceae bacterium]
SLGTAVLGAVFASSLAARVDGLPADEAAAVRLGPATNLVEELPFRLQAVREAAIAAAINNAFLVASLVGLAGFAFAWLLPELPLRRTILAASEGDVGGAIGQAMSMPSDGESATQLRRGISVLAERASRDRAVS